ncbi:MAG: HD domain-containing protein [Armatimonadota bacterium]|nr:MAG: HD domain-containing protein [Armatimonadota bacterium]
MGTPRDSAAGDLPRGGVKDYAPDKARKQLLWLAFGLIAMLGVAFVVLVAYGEDSLAADYNELLLLIGLLAFLTCTVAYFADKERQHRIENRSLIQQLHDTAQALDARVTRLNKLCQTSTELTGQLDVERISELVVEALVGQVQADAASLVLLDKSGGQYLCAHSKGPLAELGSGNDMPMAIARAAADEGGPAMRSVEGSPDLAEQLETWAKVRASISAPVKVSEIVGGALAAMRADDFSTEDLNLLTTLANMASKAIESAELHEELRHSYFRTLHVLALSLAARDPYSAAHGEAVTWLACRLAKAMSLDGEAGEALRAYGPLHDLGKIGIADSVLLKQGPLTDEELEICRQHPVIGEQIIRPLNPGAAVLSMIRNHHERWDGGGYPDALNGEQIPMLARIVAVADAFHAMISHRPYRPGIVVFEAVQEIRSLASAQFDPAVVRAVVQLWESGEVAKFNMRPGDAADSVDLLDRSVSVPAPPPLTD